MADDMFGGARPVDVSFRDMLGCVDRELAMRRKVYPRWVAQGKLGQAQADLEILRMEAVRLRLLASEALDRCIVEGASKEDFQRYVDALLGLSRELR